MADLTADSLKQDIRTRLREIESQLASLDDLVAERDRLNAALEALGERPVVIKQRSTARRSGSKRRGARGKRARRGHNKEIILAIISERPGVSIGEVVNVAVERGVASKPTVYNSVGKYVKDGLVTKADDGALTVSTS